MEILRKLCRSKYAFLLLAVLSAIIYLKVSFAIGARTDASMLDFDENEYYTIAQDLLSGKYELNPRRTLGFAWFLAFLQFITRNNLVVIQLVITFLFSLSSPLTYLLVKRMTKNNVLAVVVGVLVIVWPPFLFYGRTLYSETLALPAFIGFLLLLPGGALIQEKPDRRAWRWALAGAWLGVCMLIRPMYLIFSPLAIAILFLEEPSTKIALRRALWLTIGCSLTVLPWSIYMTTQTGVPVLLSANAGETLGGGLNPVLVKSGYQEFVTPDGRKSWGGPGKWLPLYENGYLTQEELKLPYAQTDRLLRQRTINWVMQHPGDALYLQTAKLLYMWGFYPFWQGVKQTIGGNVPSILAVLLSLASIVRFRAYWRQLSRFWLLPIFVSLVALVSWGSWRFRQPGDLGLLVLSSLFVLALWIPVSTLLQFPSRLTRSTISREKVPL